MSSYLDIARRAAEHIETDKHPDAPAVTLRPSVPAPQPPRSPSVTAPTYRADSLSDLITKARANPSPHISKAAQRAQDAIQRLRDVMAEHDSRASARREVERLERQLAEAKAKLRGGSGRPVVRSGSPAYGVTAAGEFLCEKGCGRICTTIAGRLSHERHCAGQVA